MRLDPEELAAMRDDFRRTPPRRCADEFCGARDCKTCYPASYDRDEDDETTNAEKGETHV